MTHADRFPKTASNYSPLVPRNDRRRAFRIVAALIVSLPMLTTLSTVRAGEHAGTMRLDYENGLLSASLENVPLRQVLAALEQRTAIEVRPGSPATGAPTVTITVRSVRLAEGLKRILEDTSYVMDNRNGLLVLHLLSTSPGLATKAGAMGIRESQRIARINPAERMKPRTLKEFRPVLFHDASIDSESAPDEVTENLHEQQRDEFLLERALDALDSNEVQVHEEAIDALADIDDERAIRTLAEIALGMSSNPAGIGSEGSIRATTALSKWAARPAHLDGSDLMMGVFEQLAQSDEESIRGIALATLDDMRARRYRASHAE